MKKHFWMGYTDCHKSWQLGASVMTVRRTLRIAKGSPRMCQRQSICQCQSQLSERTSAAQETQQVPTEGLGWCWGKGNVLDTIPGLMIILIALCAYHCKLILHFNIAFFLALGILFACQPRARTRTRTTRRDKARRGEEMTLSRIRNAWLTFNAAAGDVAAIWQRTLRNA